MLDMLFDYAGRTLQWIARALLRVVLVGCVLNFIIALFTTPLTALGSSVITLVLAVLSGVVGSLVLYGFGVIVEEHETARLTRLGIDPDRNTWLCSCGTKNPMSRATCDKCGYPKPNGSTPPGDAQT